MRRLATVAAAFVFGGVAALLIYSNLRRAAPIAPNHSAWVEVKWPFLLDQWGEGRSFECNAAACRVGLKLYIRSKIGFCSSATGVADDDELERLSDFDFMKGADIPLGGGHEISVGWMKGRFRAYTFANRDHQPASAISIAYNNGGDAVVVTALVDGERPSAGEPAILEFLNGKEMLRWVKPTPARNPD